MSWFLPEIAQSSLFSALKSLLLFVKKSPCIPVSVMISSPIYPTFALASNHWHGPNHTCPSQLEAISPTTLFFNVKNGLLPLFRPSSFICFKGDGPNSSSTGRNILLTRTLLLENTKQGPCHGKTVLLTGEETTAAVMAHFVLWQKIPTSYSSSARPETARI